MKNNTVTIVIVAVVVAAVAFFGGMKYQQSKASANGTGGQFAQGGPRNGQFGQGRFGGRNGAGATVGEVVSIDANSVTVKLPDGSSKIVNLAGSTTYSKTDTASKNELKTGDRIAVFGTSNSDGSVTAQNVQLNPMFRMGPGGQRPSPTQ